MQSLTADEREKHCSTINNSSLGALVGTTHYHTKTSRLLHWSMALILLSMLCLGLSMVQSLAIWQTEAVRLHKSFGLLALLLVIFRLINKTFSCSPTRQNELPKWQIFLARMTHAGMYAAMILMPTSGWLMQSADGRVVSFFGWLTIPKIIEHDIETYALFREMHAIIAWLFLIMIFMHIGAALYHGLVKRDNVLSSMLFGKNDLAE